MQLKDSSSKLETTGAIDAIQTWLTNQIAKQLGINAKTIKVDEPLTRYGLDSIDSVTIVGDLEDWLEAELPSTLLWDYPTLEKAVRYVVNDLGVSPTASAMATPVAVSTATAAAPAGKGWGGLWNKISGS